jgi:hypothetical protein
MIPTLTAHARRAIAVEALCDDRSVRRAYAGAPIRQLTRERIVRAARKLALPLPPDEQDETTPRAA